MPFTPTLAIVHPLVLLSTVDNYTRIAKDTKKRVVGVLLGEATRSGSVDITNSFAVPFDEDETQPKIWFLDHNFLENMFSMFKKVNARENIVGWYSTGPTIRACDIDIHEVFKRYTPNPVLVVIDVRPQELGLPTKAYISVEEVKEDASESCMTFQHIPSEIRAVEAEVVGVEHLLRDIKDTSISTLATQVQQKILSLKHMSNNLQMLSDYLTQVAAGKLPMNHEILRKLQDVFNLLPNLNLEQLARSFAIKTNDMMLVIYLSSLIRSIIALHNLINNKIANRDAERRAEKKEMATE
eukprot:TRINITY_DN562_c1_g2_i1.p1 TRINITY_DN562_c1_g2~~TRINITY_DN562_c1_g2_i1.p1  ORF type:complete len:297 (-),score=151.99 TRINITY_DN562_c1_g2_i1:159-1049(-)